MQNKALLLIFGFAVLSVLMKADGVSLPIQTKIVVVFGYKDTRPSRLVGDRYERAVFLEKLLKLGFHRNPKDDDELNRPLENKNGMLNVKVIHSSVGPDDDENRRDPYQSHQSKIAHEAFLSAIQVADVVLYNGHSRDGGGPDFLPPRYLENGHVDYAWYRRKREGFKELMALWKKPHHRLQELGLISCYSNQHFSAALEANGIKLTTISGLIYYADALEKMVEIVRGYASEN